MRRIIVAATLFAIATPAIAAEPEPWVEFSQDGTQRYYINVKDLAGREIGNPNARDVRAWIKTEDSAPGAVPKVVSFMSVNCVERQFHLLQVIEYDSSGVVTTHDPTPGRRSFIPPDSKVEFIADVLCLPRSSQ